MFKRKTKFFQKYTFKTLILIYLFFAEFYAFAECYWRVRSTRIRGLTQEELGVVGTRGSIPGRKPTGFLNEATVMQPARGSSTPKGKGGAALEETSSRR